MALYGMHYRNRALRGPDLDHLALDCTVVLESGERSDPAAHDDRSWITATWTEDGRRAAALLHHEFQADAHPGRCRAGAYRVCRYNTITAAAASADAGRSFGRTTPPAVVAGAPFRQEVDQGRHRGASSTPRKPLEHRLRRALALRPRLDHRLWARPGGDQDAGVCLFRSADPADPDRWRAWTGTGFTAAFPDPYRAAVTPPGTCRRGRFPGRWVPSCATGAYIAVFRAKAGEGFERSGFYWTTSRDLLARDRPRLLVAGATLHDDPCAADAPLIAHPALLDPGAQGRDFDDVGDGALLTYATLRTAGCAITSDRDLVPPGGDPGLALTVPFGIDARHEGCTLACPSSAPAGAALASPA